jgi:hypothetical protein
MRLTTTMQVSVDGVIQGGGGPDDGRRGGSERGGWGVGHAGTTFTDESSGA